MAIQTSPEHPAPVRQIASAIAGWIDRLGAVWVEGQIAQLNRRQGMNTVFLTLRDTVADISIQVTCSRQVFDSLNPPVVEGGQRGGDRALLRLGARHLAESMLSPAVVTSGRPGSRRT